MLASTAAAAELSQPLRAAATATKTTLNHTFIVSVFPG